MAVLFLTVTLLTPLTLLLKEGKLSKLWTDNKEITLFYLSLCPQKPHKPVISDEAFYNIFF